MRFLLLILICLSFAAKASNTEKIYSVPETRPEILIGNSAPALKKDPGARPENQNFIGIVRGSLNYDLPVYNHAAPDFAPRSIGLSLSRKSADKFFLYNGNVEIGGEWQGFERKQGIFSQKLNIFQLNFFQNFDLAWSNKHPVLFSAGVGISPVYLTVEQSVFGNSLSGLGGMGLIKLDFILPLRAPFELDFVLKSGWGRVAEREIFLSNIGLGINYE